MTGHEHHTTDVIGMLLALPFVVAMLLYLLCALISNRRFKRWSRLRTTYWIIGSIGAICSVYGPLSQWAHADFRGHMIAHLLLGMLSPLLMVLAAPITLAIRALPVHIARKWSRWLRAKPLHLIMNPFVASLLNVGGLWLLYKTDLFHLMHMNSWLYMFVHIHIFLAGYLFTASMIDIDHSPNRSSYLFRSIVFIVALAAHGILAKVIYAFPPTGVDRMQAESGAMLMFYGGDLIDAVIILILCYQWYRQARPRTKQDVAFIDL